MLRTDSTQEIHLEVLQELSETNKELMAKLEIALRVIAQQEETIREYEASSMRLVKRPHG